MPNDNPPVTRIHGLVIGADRLFLEAVLFSLNKTSSREIIFVGWGVTLAEAKAKLTSSGVEIVLFQPPENREEALETVRELKTFIPEAILAVIGDEAREEHILSFIEAGASIFVSPRSAVREAVSSIEALERGEIFCSPRLITMVVSRIRQLSSPTPCVQPRLLSARQREIMQLISNGFSNKEIANHLGVSTSTAKNHVHQVLKKLNAHRRRDAIRKACEAEILTGAFPGSLSVRDLRHCS